MSNVVLNTNVHIVAVQPTPQSVVIVQPTQQAVVVDTSKIGPPGPAGIVNTSAAYTWSNVLTFSSNIVLGAGLSANGSYGSAGQVLHSNGSSTYWAIDDNAGGTVTSIATGNGLSGGPITTTGTISILANTGVVANSTGLFVNSAYISTLAANSATYLGGNTASDLRTYTDQKAGNAYSNAVSYADNRAANAYSNAIAYSGNAAQAYSNAVSYVDGKSYVNTSQLSNNLSNYALLSGATFTGNVAANDANITYDLNVGRNLTVSGNLTIIGTSTTLQGNVVTFTDNMLYLNQGILATITNVSGNGTYITFTANNNYQNGWDILVTGVNPSSYNGTYQNIFLANATHFVVANTNTASYVSGGTARGKSDQNPDLGFAAGYNDGTYHHTGFFRDASDGYWKVFDNYAPEPDASVNIDTSNNTFHLANFQANSLALGNTSVNWITANATALALANTVAIYANGSYGSANQVLSSNGSGLYWSDNPGSNGSYSRIQYSDGAGGFASYDNFYYTQYTDISTPYSYLDLYSSTDASLPIYSWFEAKQSNYPYYSRVLAATEDTTGLSGQASLYTSQNAAPAINLYVYNNSGGPFVFGDVTINIPTTTTGSYTYTLTLPDSAGSNGQVLTTDGSGNLFWTAGAATAYSNAIAYSGNAAQAYSNAVSYVDGKSYVNTSQLSANLSNYQTTSGLAANVVLLAANSASYIVSPVTTVNTNYTVLANDSVILANTTSAITLTLPSAAGIVGKSYEIKNINTGTVNIVGTGGQTIDGYSNLVIQYKNSMLGVRSLGTSWMIY